MGAALGLTLAAGLATGVGLAFGVGATGSRFSSGPVVLACVLLATRALLLVPTVAVFFFLGVAAAMASAISKKLFFAGRVLGFWEEDSEGLEEVPDDRPGKPGLVWLEELDWLELLDGPVRIDELD